MDGEGVGKAGAEDDPDSQVRFEQLCGWCMTPHHGKTGGSVGVKNHIFLILNSRCPLDIQGQTSGR